jgi:hypothetical protein
MRLLKLLAVTAAVTTIMLAFRDRESGAWILPELGLGDDEREADDVETGGAEPVLGYDGMDVETLLDWLEDADLDEETLLEIEAYERGHRNRGAVLEALGAMIG